VVPKDNFPESVVPFVPKGAQVPGVPFAIHTHPSKFTFATTLG